MSESPDTSSHSSARIFIIGVVVLAIASVPLWSGLTRLGLTPSERLQFLVLLYTLIVLLRYAYDTRQLAVKAAEQSAASQAAVAIESDRRIHERRPTVVIDWEREGATTGWTYVARNVGQGVALNVVHVRDLEANQLQLHYIGALRSGERVELPRELVDELNQEARQPLDRRRHVVIAEPVGGERLWVVSENLVERGGRVSHRVREVLITDRTWRQIHRVTIEEYVGRNWQAIRADLLRKMKDLQPPSTPLTETDNAPEEGAAEGTLHG